MFLDKMTRMTQHYKSFSCSEFVHKFNIIPPKYPEFKGIYVQSLADHKAN